MSASGRARFRGYDEYSSASGIMRGCGGKVKSNGGGVRARKENVKTGTWLASRHSKSIDIVEGCQSYNYRFFLC